MHLSYVLFVCGLVLWRTQIHRPHPLRVCDVHVLSLSCCPPYSDLDFVCSCLAVTCEGVRLNGRAEICLRMVSVVFCWKIQRAE